MTRQPITEATLAAVKANLAIVDAAIFLQGKLAAEESFRVFVEQAWHVLEPVTRFLPGIHVDAICAHLQAVTPVRGDVRV